ncbi:MAG: AAA family ATPase [Tissierellia bacterium]|nr:AAA family ATPase [Tissierellia bacterium]
MIKIKSVRIKNFQSHKDSLIEFSEGFNAFVGPSNTGKTAIIRAIKWALYNEPAGDYFLRDNEKRVEVEITFNNNIKLLRYRGSGKNGYKLTMPDGSTEIYEGFGYNIPLEITDAINIVPMQITDDLKANLNISDQLEAPFLISESPSGKANAIGKLVGVDYVDKAQRKTSLDISRSNTIKRQKCQTRDNLKNEISKFDYLKNYNENLTKLKTINQEIKSKNSKLIINKDIYEKYKEINVKKEYTKNILSKLNRLDEFEQFILKLHKLTFKLKNISTLKTELLKINSSQNKLMKMVDAFKGIDKLEINLEDIKKNTEKLNFINRYNNLYKNNIKEIKINKNNLIKLRHLENAYSNYENILMHIGNYNRLNQLKENYKNIENSLKIGNNYILAFKNLDDIIKRHNKLNLLTSNIKYAIHYKNQYEELSKKKVELKKYIKDISSQINDEINVYAETLKKYNICPTCFNKICEHDIENVIKSLRS